MEVHLQGLVLVEERVGAPLTFEIEDADYRLYNANYHIFQTPDYLVLLSR